MKKYLAVETRKIHERYEDKRRQLKTPAINKLNADFARKTTSRSFIKIACKVAAVIAGIIIVCMLINTLSRHAENEDWLLLVPLIIVAVMVATSFAFTRIDLVDNARYNVRKKREQEKLERAIQQLDSEAAIRQLEREEEEEMRKLKSDVKKRVDAYGQRYWEKGFIPFVVQWLMSDFADVIEKADRSSYYPQIKAEMSFTVYTNRIEVYRNGQIHPDATYDLQRQGLSVDGNPLSLSALAYVLGSKFIESAVKSFTADPGGGGKPVITSEWDDEKVNVYYTAPNGVRK